MEPIDKIRIFLPFTALGRRELNKKGDGMNLYEIGFFNGNLL